MLQQVEVAKLAVGMYIAELDRPWLETPFPLQGFYVRSSEDIGQLESFCQMVMVDPRRFDARIAAVPSACEAPSPPEDDDSTPDPGVRPAGVGYVDVSKAQDELPAAQQALSSSDSTFQTLWKELSSRRRVDIANLKNAVHPLVDSILRNKDALVTLMRVQHQDRHTHEHCIALAVWASLLGRQLGLPPDEIKKLALGCSLVDIGKIRLPKQMLHKPGKLPQAEYAIIQSHVDYSLQMVADMGAKEDDIVGTVRWHHERMDGSGYPDGLKGSAIPMFARIAGIVDSYDAMISPRSYAETLSSHEALVELQDLCPDKFQVELVDQFAQAIGLFPNGCLVELSSGEVGVVFGQNPGRRLRPKVMLILDSDKNKRNSMVIVDLKEVPGHTLRISRELAQNEFGIDAREFFL